MVALFKNQRKAVRTPRVKFYLERRKGKDGEVITVDVPIIFSVSYGGRYKSFTGIRIDADLWNQQGQRIVASHTHATRLNKALSKLKSELEGVCYDAWDKGERLSPAYISGRLKKNQQSAGNFFQYFDEYIKEGGTKWAKGTTTKFTTLKSHLMEFGRKCHTGIAFDLMDEVFFKKLADFYFDAKKTTPEGEVAKFYNPYIKKNFSFIKSFLIWAEEKGYNKNPDFRKYCKLETGKKKQQADINIIALTIREFLLMYNYSPVSESHKRAKDYLILACATGLRFSDIANLKKGDVDYHQGVIKCVTLKTGDTAIIPFNEFSRMILEKYKNTPNYNSKKQEMAFPCISNQKMNEAVKAFAKDAGVTDMVSKVQFYKNERKETVTPKYKLISTHTGRKTFISLNVWLGVKSEITMGMTTHSDHSMMEQYYQVNLEMKKDAMKLFSIKNLKQHAKN